MKKTLSFVLVLALVLGSFSSAFAATSAETTAAKTAVSSTVPADVDGTAYEAPVTVLTALGVVSGYEDGSYKPANNVTRAEFAKLIIAELGLEANAQAAKSTFKDMSGYGWADGYVGYAASLGIIKGYGDGSFKPANNVTHDEALTMIVRALGYTSDCKEMNGTWPAIYVQKARVLGITDDVTVAGAVAANRGDVATYLYNALTCNMGYADDKGVFIEKKDKDGDPIKVATSLDAKEYDYTIITNSDADSSLVNIRDFVGSYSKVFRLTKGKNENDIIAISDTKSDFISGEYDASGKKLKTADGTEYLLDDVMNSVQGTSKDVKSKTATQFVNGKVDASAGKTILNSGLTGLDTAAGKKIVTMAADLSGKTVKGIYSVSIWSKMASEKVDADDIATIKNNKTLLGKEFKKDNNDKEIDLTSFELLGVKSLDDIKVDNVVYVYYDNDDKITRVAVGTQTVEGEVTAIKESADPKKPDNTKVTIGGKTYLFAGEKLGLNGLSNDFAAGDVDVEDVVKVYLDAYGYMFDYDAVSGKADNYAVVLEVGGGSGALGSKHEVKLFLADGTDKVFNVDNDLFTKSTEVVAGVTTISNGQSNNYGWLVTGGAIVKYGLDKDGMIDSFENLTGTSKTYQTVSNTSSSAIDITDAGYYDNIQIRPNAVIFSYEYKTLVGDRSDEDNYGVTTLEKVKKSKDIGAIYVKDKNKIAAMLMYDYSGSDAIYGVVTKAEKTAGTSDYKATVFIDGVEKTYGMSGTTPYNKARAVDSFTGTGLQKIDFNASGEIKDFTPAWDDSAINGVGGDTYATASALKLQKGEASFNNNTFTTTTTKMSLVKLKDSNKNAYDKPLVNTIQVQNNAIVYKRDTNGDWKVGSGVSELKSLNAGASVWFYDTKDDNNMGLMNIILVDNPESDSTTTNGTTYATDGTIAYAMTNGSGVSTIQIGTTPYTVTGVAQAAFGQIKNLFDGNGLPKAGTKVDVSFTTASNDPKTIVGFTTIVATVNTDADFGAAELIPGITQIVLGASTSPVTYNLEHLINVNIGATTGNSLNVLTAATGSMTVSGTGTLNNLTVNTANATFTNNVAVTGTLDVKAVSTNTMNQNASVENLTWEATGATLNLGSSATVKTATFNATATVTGADKIATADVKLAGVKLDKAPTVLKNNGFDVQIGGSTTTAGALALTAATSLVVTAENLTALNNAFDLTLPGSNGAFNDAIVAAEKNYSDAYDVVDVLANSTEKTALADRLKVVKGVIETAKVKQAAYNSEATLDGFMTNVSTISFTGYDTNNKALAFSSDLFKTVKTVADVNAAIAVVNEAANVVDATIAKTVTTGTAITATITGAANTGFTRTVTTVPANDYISLATDGTVTLIKQKADAGNAEVADVIVTVSKGAVSTTMKIKVTITSQV